MFIARMICSDEECPDQFEVTATTVAELETLACECGCALEILGWPDHDDCDDGIDRLTEVLPLGQARLLAVC